MSRKVSDRRSKMSREELETFVMKEHKRYSPKLPSYVNKFFDVDELKEADSICYRMVPKKDFNGTYIVYLYGGGMSRSIAHEQWDFIVKLALETGVALFVPMYPLTPEYSCQEVFEMLQPAYSNITKNFAAERIVLLGDSSGAGLALSLAILAWKEGMRKPDQLVMLSPALDTEFFDTELEKKLLEGTQEENFFFTKVAKDFINMNWVRDYAAKTEYTSPYYEDYTDICDDIAVFSGEDDMMNCYARAFYKKAKQQGIGIRLFEFEGEKHDFMIYAKSEEQKSAFGYLTDVIKHNYEHSLCDIYPVKLKSDWTKRYPKLIQDEWSSKFIYDNKFDFSGVSPKLSEYKDLMLVANTVACESKVRKFIMEYPNCTIVHVGCRLGNMFESMDNGRIQWYNVDAHNMMSVRRSMYGEREREKTLGRSLMDFSWVEDIVCIRDQGIMFICDDAFTYLTKQQVKNLVHKIWEMFPGAELVFTAATTGATIWENHRYKKSIMLKKKKHMSVNDAQKLLASWRTDYRVMAEEPVTKYLGSLHNLKWTTRIGLGYNMITYNHKIIHVKLGNEAYVIKV